MKKIISILLFGLICLANGVYAQDNQLSKFEGIWQWKSNDSTYTVILKQVTLNGKKYHKDMPDKDYNILIGWYELKVSGNTASTSMRAKRTTFNYQKRDYSIFATPKNIVQNGQKIYLAFMIPGHDMSNVTFTIQPTGDAQWWYKKIPNVTPGVVVMKKIE